MEDITVVHRRRDFRLVRTQRPTSSRLLGCSGCSMRAALQPYMFGKGFTTRFLFDNATVSPTPSWIINNIGNLVAPHVAVWNTFFAPIQVVIAFGCSSGPPSGRRCSSPRVGLRRLVLRGRHRPGLHRTATALHRRTGLGHPLWPPRPDGVAPVSTGGKTGRPKTRVGIRPPPPGQGSAERRLRCRYGAGLGARHDPVPPPGQPDPDSVSSAITGMSPGAPSGYSHFLPASAASPPSARRTTWLLAVALLVVGSARWWSRSDAVPGCRRPAVHMLLGHGPGSRRYLHRVGH